MEIGDKIKIFPETNKNQYKNMIRTMGFKCVVKNNYIIITDTVYRREEEKAVIGRSITKARRKAGLSRKEMCKKLGIKNTYTVFNWEVGRNVPNKRNQKKLKELLGWEGITK